jgi:chitinase
MGFGFYGRSFTLSNPKCTKPGCPFSGASKPGPCTKTGGILGYYEIQQILNGNSKRAVSPVHDTTAAVNYLVFDDDQWVSYDDKTTFKQKTDWADSVGIGGSLIWASDLDNPDFSAHSALLQKKVTQSAGQLTLSDKDVYVEGLMSGKGCERFDDCVDLNNPQATNCERNGEQLLSPTSCLCRLVCYPKTSC